LNIDAELLMKDILKNGLNQPLQVTKMGDLYRILDGNHRLRALKILGWTKIPCMVLDGKWQ